MSPTTLLDLPDEVLGVVLAQLSPLELPIVKDRWTSSWSPVSTRLLRTHAAAFGPLSDVRNHWPIAINDPTPLHCQRDLARCARVCRRFHRIATPLLYFSPIIPYSTWRQFVATVGSPRDADLVSLVSGRDHIEFVHLSVHYYIHEAIKPLQDVLADAPRLRVDIVKPWESAAAEAPVYVDNSRFRVAVQIENTGRPVVSGPPSLRKRPYEALERASYFSIRAYTHGYYMESPAHVVPEWAAQLNLAVQPNRLTSLEQLHVHRDPSPLGVTLAAILAAAPRLTLAVFECMNLEQWRAAWPFAWRETSRLVPEHIAQVPAHVATLHSLAANLVPRMDWLLLFPGLVHLNLSAELINVRRRYHYSAALGLASAAKYVIDCEGWISAMIQPCEHIALAAIAQLGFDTCSTYLLQLKPPDNPSANDLPSPAVFETQHDDEQPRDNSSSVDPGAEFVDPDAKFGLHTAASVMAVLCHPRCRPQLETLVCENAVLGQSDLFRLLDCQPRLVELRAGRALLNEPPMYRPLRPALNLTTLSLADCPIRTDATLSLLARSCPALETLSLCVWFTDQRGDGLAAVARLQPLRHLKVHVILFERPLPSFNAADSQLACFWRSLAPAAGRLRWCAVRVCVQYASVPELALAMWPTFEMREFVFACTQARFHLEADIHLADPSPLIFLYKRHTTDAYPRRWPFQFRDHDGHFMHPYTDDTMLMVLHSMFSASSLPRVQRSARAWLRQNAVVSADGVSIAVRRDASIDGFSRDMLCGDYLKLTDIRRHPVLFTMCYIHRYRLHRNYPWVKDPTTPHHLYDRD